MKTEYSRIQRITEIVAIGLFTATAAGLVWKIVDGLESPASWWTLTISIVTGYVLSDLVSGIVHWLADRYGAESTPVIGKILIRPFREHHRDPNAIARHDFIETNGSNCIVSAPCMTAAVFGLSAADSLFSTFVLGAILALCLSVFGTNQFHKWAHMADAPRIARVLGEAGIILGPKHHDTHHIAPFQTNYCITTGWWNPVLERLRVFRIAEGAIELVTGARPAEASEPDSAMTLGDYTTHGS